MSKFNDRTGETRVMQNGLKATIIEYRNNADFDLMFENGAVVRCGGYHTYKKGHVRCPMIIKEHEEWLEVINPNLRFSFIIDKEDRSIVEGKFWLPNKKGYACDSNHTPLHRIIMNAKPDEQVDHRNLKKTDDRRCNLRVCNNSQNQRNRKAQKSNTSGYKGINYTPRMKKWRARIATDNGRLHLGYHDTKEKAALAYNAAALKYHGEFARLNEIK